jgi:WD40 repeat protein
MVALTGAIGYAIKVMGSGWRVAPLLFGSLVVFGNAGGQSTPQGGGTPLAGRVRLRGLDSWEESVAFSPDGSLFASEGSDHVTKLFDMKSGAAVFVIPNSGRGVAFSPDSSILAVSTSAHTIELHDSRSGKLIRTLPVAGPFAFSPDGSTIAAVSPNLITLFDTQTGQGRFSFKDNCSQVYSLAFSPDGVTVATGNIDGLVRLFDTSSGRQKMILPGNRERVDVVAFSPDGALIASGGKDGMLRL